MLSSLSLSLSRLREKQASMSSPKAKEFINEEGTTFDVLASFKTEEVLSSSSEVLHRVIKDIESDRAFLERLKESRKIWDLDDISSLREHACTSCSLGASVGWRATEILKELTHDVVNLVAYYHDCEDKSKEYECQYCVDQFNGVEDEEAELYACPSECGCNDCERISYDSHEDYSYSYDDKEHDDEEENFEERRERFEEERKIRKAFIKRNQRDHIEHLSEEHENKLNIFLRFKQNFIPLCETGFWGFRNCDLTEVLRHMSLKKGIKFLHMKKAPCPTSPKSPKLWKYIMGRENDDHDYYYQNKWDDSFNEY